MSFDIMNADETNKDADKQINLRAYQLEMLDESLKGNVIVAVYLTPSFIVITTNTSNTDGYWQRKNTRVSYGVLLQTVHAVI